MPSNIERCIKLLEITFCTAEMKYCYWGATGDMSTETYYSVVVGRVSLLVLKTECPK